MNYILRALEPGMLQEMLIAAAILMIPLERKTRPIQRIVLGLTAGFLLGGTLSLIDMSALNIDSQLFYILEDFLILGCVYLSFRFCTQLSASDALYAMTCAYVAQHASFCLTIVLHYVGIGPFSSFGESIFGWCIFLLIGGSLSLAVNRYIPIQGHYKIPIHRVIIMTVIVLLLAIAFPSAIVWAGEMGGTVAVIICQGYDLCGCLLFMWLQVGLRQEVRLLASLETERQIRRQMQEQYELSHNNIDIINQKCHDLKHQIAGLRFVEDQQERDKTLAQLENSVMLYDTSMKTGNEVLDTVLTEKSLLCANAGISWTCMADGAQMEFISPVDLYTMLGNALDNAIESSQKLPLREQRVIRVIVRRQFGAVFIQISNYYDHLEDRPDGRLQTTKPDKEYHGFGLSSIERIVRSYDGTMNIETQNGIFLLSILIPYSNVKRA